MTFYIELLAMIAICLGFLAFLFSMFMIFATRQLRPHLTNAGLGVLIIVATICAVSLHG